jgi:succinate dehydrogenase / fumarate reductase flavoprotein subunit
MYHQFKELAEVDITKEPMEVGPTFHYAMGGIRVDHESQMCPTVPGLFACGEVGAGLHGANRLGGNSLSDLLVFGRRAGLGAKAFIDANPGEPRVDEAQVKALLDKAKAPLMREKGENPYVIHDELRESMTRNVGIWRDGDGMKQGIADLAAFRERARNVKAHGSSQYNPEWSEAVDLESLFVCAEATARSGLMREESRGAHSREDFQGERKEWVKYNIVVRKGTDGQMVVEKIERKDGPPDLVRLANASIEDVERGNV